MRGCPPHPPHSQLAGRRIGGNNWAPFTSISVTPQSGVFNCAAVQLFFFFYQNGCRSGEYERPPDELAFYVDILLMARICMSQASALIVPVLPECTFIGTPWTVMCAKLLKISVSALVAEKDATYTAAISHALGQIGYTPVNYLPHLLSAKRVHFQPPSEKICLALIWLRIYSLVRERINFGRPLT